MKILWITLESALPANSGGRLGVYKRLEQVVKTEEVYLFYPYDKEEELKYADELRKVCAEVHPYFRGANKKHALLNILKYPYTVGSRCIVQMQEDIKSCVQKHPIDRINVDFPHMCVNLFDMDLQIPIILNEHNIEWKVYKTIADSQKNIWKKAAYWIDSFRLKAFELKIFRELHIRKVTFVSKNDMAEMIASGILDRNKCVLIPVGADVREAKGSSLGALHKGHNIIYVGNMSYGPNIEAVTWFVKDILPLILKQISQVKFYIVGKEPSHEVKSLAGKHVVVTGAVDSVDEYYNLADLVVLPLKNGGGVKVKLLEAVSYQKPIVSSSVGVEGTIYSDGKSIPVADTPTEFADKCAAALMNQSNDLAEAAYSIFTAHYTWVNIGKQYVDMMRNI